MYVEHYLNVKVATILGYFQHFFAFFVDRISHSSQSLGVADGRRAQQMT